MPQTSFTMDLEQLKTNVIEAENAALCALQQVETVGDLERLKPEILGKKCPLRQLMRLLGQLDSGLRPAAGAVINEAVARVENAYEARLSDLRDAELETIVAWLSDTLTARDAAVLVRSNAEVAWLKARLKLRGIDAPVMTIHASKGREWDAVVLALGMRKPSETAHDALQTWYVGITRAKRQLLLTSVGLMPQALEDAWAAVRGGQATAAPQDGTFASRGTADVQEVGQRADAGT